MVEEQAAENKIDKTVDKSDDKTVEKTDSGKSYKNFRSYDEIEKIYRFVHENVLRTECVKVLEQIKLIAKRKAKKTRRRSKKILQ